MASYSGNAITTAELKTVLTSLKNQREAISNEYNNNIRRVLDSSSSCFSVAGLDYNTIIDTFDDTFSTMDKNFENLIYVLENNIIKNYTELVAAIRQMFGKSFADKLTNLLGINSK
ncbi:MAG: hypothetical protein IJI58_02125 [Bacilli bacterium]|nr:hypothetical protein [Bacilli bacterium]